MSVGYTVLVPSEKWPTAGDFQRTIASRGYPIQLTGLDTADYEKPLAPTKNVGGLDVQIEDQRVNLHAAMRAVSGKHFVDDETNDILEELGAEFRVRDGDYQFGVGLGSDENEWRAAFFVMAALIKDFGGYGYEMQSETHGADEWADRLLTDPLIIKQKIK